MLYSLDFGFPYFDFSILFILYLLFFNFSILFANSILLMLYFPFLDFMLYYPYLNVLYFIYYT